MTRDRTPIPPYDSPFLNRVQAEEVRLGNPIAQDGNGWGKIKRLIILRSPFRSSLTDLPSDVEYHLINDPHYWQAELKDASTSEMLACGFALGRG